MPKKLNLPKLMDDAKVAPLTTAQFLADHLKKLELNATQASRKMGVSQSTLSRFLAGKSALTIELAIRIAKTFPLPLEALFRYDAGYKIWQAKQLLNADNGGSA